MNNIKNKIIKELSNKYKKKEKVVQIMYEKSKEVGYTIKEIKNLIKQFYS